MLQNHKISQHKADIEKRIQDLQSKLQNTAKNKQLHQGHPFDTSLPIRRIYAQNQQYLQPQAVTILRQRQTNLEKRESWQSGIKETNRIGFEKIARKNEEADHAMIHKKNKQNDNPDSLLLLEQRTQQLLNRHKNEIPQNNQLYGLVTQILQKQRNLQDQIDYLKSELSKQQKGRKEQLSKKKQEKKYHIVSFQQQQNNEKKPIAQFHKNSTADLEGKELNQELPKAFMGDDNENVHQVQNEKVVKQREPHLKNTIEKPRKSRNTISSSKKRTVSRHQQRPQDQIKIESLIKSQKSRNQRLIVSEQCKSEFWKKVQLRIRESSNEYNQSFHRNNRFINDHLVNTNELQKKLRDEVIAKVYSQCNNCVYK